MGDPGPSTLRIRQLQGGRGCEQGLSEEESRKVIKKVESYADLRDINFTTLLAKEDQVVALLKRFEGDVDRAFPFLGKTVDAHLTKGLSELDQDNKDKIQKALRAYSSFCLEQDLPTFPILGPSVSLFVWHKYSPLLQGLEKKHTLGPSARKAKREKIGSQARRLMASLEKVRGFTDQACSFIQDGKKKVIVPKVVRDIGAGSSLGSPGGVCFETIQEIMGRDADAQTSAPKPNPNPQPASQGPASDDSPPPKGPRRNKFTDGPSMATGSATGSKGDKGRVTAPKRKQSGSTKSMLPLPKGPRHQTSTMGLQEPPCPALSSQSLAATVPSQAGALRSHSADLSLQDSDDEDTEPEVSFVEDQPPELPSATPPPEVPPKTSPNESGKVEVQQGHHDDARDNDGLNQASWSGKTADRAISVHAQKDSAAITGTVTENAVLHVSIPPTDMANVQDAISQASNAISATGTMMAQATSPETTVTTGIDRAVLETGNGSTTTSAEERATASPDVFRSALDESNHIAQIARCMLDGISNSLVVGPRLPPSSPAVIPALSGQVSPQAGSETAHKGPTIGTFAPRTLPHRILASSEFQPTPSLQPLSHPPQETPGSSAGENDNTSVSLIGDKSDRVQSEDGRAGAWSVEPKVSKAEYAKVSASSSASERPASLPTLLHLESENSYSPTDTPIDTPSNPSSLSGRTSPDRSPPSESFDTAVAVLELAMDELSKERRGNRHQEAEDEEGDEENMNGDRKEAIDEEEEEEIDELAESLAPTQPEVDSSEGVQASSLPLSRTSHPESPAVVAVPHLPTVIPNSVQQHVQATSATFLSVVARTAIPPATVGQRYPLPTMAVHQPSISAPLESARVMIYPLQNAGPSNLGPCHQTGVAGPRPYSGPSLGATALQPMPVQRNFPTLTVTPHQIVNPSSYYVNTQPMTYSPPQFSPSFILPTPGLTVPDYIHLPAHPKIWPACTPAPWFTRTRPLSRPLPVTGVDLSSRQSSNQVHYRQSSLRTERPVPPQHARTPSSKESPTPTTLARYRTTIHSHSRCDLCGALHDSIQLLNIHIRHEHIDTVELRFLDDSEGVAPLTITRDRSSKSFWCPCGKAVTRDASAIKLHAPDHVRPHFLSSTAGAGASGGLLSAVPLPQAPTSLASTRSFVAGPMVGDAPSRHDRSMSSKTVSSVRTPTLIPGDPGAADRDRQNRSSGPTVFSSTSLAQTAVDYPSRAASVSAVSSTSSSNGSHSDVRTVGFPPAYLGFTSNLAALPQVARGSAGTPAWFPLAAPSEPSSFSLPPTLPSVSASPDLTKPGPCANPTGASPSKALPLPAAAAGPLSAQCNPSRHPSPTSHEAVVQMRMCSVLVKKADYAHRKGHGFRPSFVWQMTRLKRLHNLAMLMQASKKHTPLGSTNSDDLRIPRSLSASSTSTTTPAAPKEQHTSLVPIVAPKRPGSFSKPAHNPLQPSATDASSAIAPVPASSTPMAVEDSPSQTPAKAQTNDAVAPEQPTKASIIQGTSSSTPPPATTAGNNLPRAAHTCSSREDSIVIEDERVLTAAITSDPGTIETTPISTTVLCVQSSGLRQGADHQRTLDLQVEMRLATVSMEGTCLEATVGANSTTGSEQKTPAFPLSPGALPESAKPGLKEDPTPLDDMAPASDTSTRKRKRNDETDDATDESGDEVSMLLGVGPSPKPPPTPSLSSHVEAHPAADQTGFRPRSGNGQITQRTLTTRADVETHFHWPGYRKRLFSSLPEGALVNSTPRTFFPLLEDERAHRSQPSSKKRRKRKHGRSDEGR